MVATWDSSAHESAKLNRVTPEQERLFLVVRVVVRLSDPAPIGRDIPTNLILNKIVNNIRNFSVIRSGAAEKNLYQYLQTTVFLQFSQEKCWVRPLCGVTECRRSDF